MFNTKGSGSALDCVDLKRMTLRDKNKQQCVKNMYINFQAHDML